MIPGPGFEPGPHWWEGNALTTAPSLLPSTLRALLTTNLYSGLHDDTIILKLTNKIHTFTLGFIIRILLALLGQ